MANISVFSVQDGNGEYKEGLTGVEKDEPVTEAAEEGDNSMEFGGELEEVEVDLEEMDDDNDDVDDTDDDGKTEEIVEGSIGNADGVAVDAAMEAVVVEEDVDVEEDGEEDAMFWVVSAAFAFFSM